MQYLPICNVQYRVVSPDASLHIYFHTYSKFSTNDQTKRHRDLYSNFIETKISFVFFMMYSSVVVPWIQVWCTHTTPVMMCTAQWVPAAETTKNVCWTTRLCDEIFLYRCTTKSLYAKYWSQDLKPEVWSLARICIEQQNTPKS